MLTYANCCWLMLNNTKWCLLKLTVLMLLMWQGALLQNFSPDMLWQGAPLQNCHWPVNDIFSRHAVAGCTFTKRHWPVNDVLKCLENCSRVHLYKTSLTGQWHFVIKCHWPVNDSFRKCHWLVNDNMPLHPEQWSTFRKMSLTGQWRSSYGHPSLRAYGQTSLTAQSMTYVHKSSEQKCHWPRSMT